MGAWRGQHSYGTNLVLCIDFLTSWSWTETNWCKSRRGWLHNCKVNFHPDLVEDQSDPTREHLSRRTCCHQTQTAPRRSTSWNYLEKNLFAETTPLPDFHCLQLFARGFDDLTSRPFPRLINLCSTFAPTFAHFSSTSYLLADDIVRSRAGFVPQLMTTWKPLLPSWINQEHPHFVSDDDWASLKRLWFLW